MAELCITWVLAVGWGLEEARVMETAQASSAKAQDWHGKLQH
jgi:hypothetical protein